MRTAVLSRWFIFGLSWLGFVPFHGATAEDGGLPSFSVAALTRRIPAQGVAPMTGSQFAAYVAGMDSRQREQAILNEILHGNVPAFLRNLVPVKLKLQPSAGSELDATLFVMPEYLAIGSNTDYMRIPMNLYTASAVAVRLGFVLPTRKIVDAIYRQSSFHFAPEPMTAGPQMRSTEYYSIHNQKIDFQFRIHGIPSGTLVSGDKKDVVLTNLLEKRPGKIAIYGWHRLDGAPIQPLTTVHGACYADYSHGIRLVSETVLVNGQARSLYDILEDSELSAIVSDEGPIPDLRGFMRRTASKNPCGEKNPAMSD